MDRKTDYSELSLIERWFQMEKSESNNRTIDLLSIGLMLGSIIYSIVLFSQGKREQAIFVGLWPPTFVALGSLLKQTFGKTN